MCDGGEKERQDHFVPNPTSLILHYLVFLSLFTHCQLVGWKPLSSHHMLILQNLEEQSFRIFLQLVSVVKSDACELCCNSDVDMNIDPQFDI